MYQTVNNGIKYLSTGAGFLNHQRYFSEAACQHRNFPPVLTVSAKDFRSQLDIPNTHSGSIFDTPNWLGYPRLVLIHADRDGRQSHCGKIQDRVPLPSRICEFAGASFSVSHSIHFRLVTLSWVPNIGDPQIQPIDATLYSPKHVLQHNNSPLGILDTACFTFPYLPYPNAFSGCLARTLGLSHFRLLQLGCLLLVGAEGRDASNSPTNPNTMGTHNLHV